jgi:tRNA1Val (adenine37-N6)-methyltransferase
VPKHHQDSLAESRGEYTADAFFDGKLLVRQPLTGYRFSIDAVLLAGFVKPGHGCRVADLGSGCGIISLLLAYRHQSLKIYGLEIQKELAEIAMSNVENNNMNGRIEILQADIKTLGVKKMGGPVDLVVCNPPYRKVDSGKRNPDLQKAVARHEIHGVLDDFIQASRRFLQVSGRLFMVYPAQRSMDLICTLRQDGMEPKRIQWVHSNGDSPAKLILVEAVKGGGPEVRVHKPLILYQSDGSYTQEVQNMMAG